MELIDVKERGETMSYIRQAIEESKEYYESRVERDIERNRKGNFSIVVEKDSKPCEAEVTYKLKKIDFDFGCNIFMLDQYEDSEQQSKYLEQWKKLFNTAVVPFYWEGTEPIQGHLRYSKEVANDVYRRPPVDRVVEYCKENGIAMKGHPLFWQEFIARWLPEEWEELYPLIEKRFKEIADRYADAIPVFDCVNEPSRLFDQQFEYKNSDWKCVFPPQDYIEQIFDMGKKYFPNNELILNEATGAAFGEYRGIYGGYYLLLEKLLNKGLKIDRIGLQCHICDSEYYKNVFDAERLYSLLDGYGSLGKPIVLSEIGLSCEDEEIQAMAAERLYKICFSHEAMSGIFWWNLDDNGILCDKERNAQGENLPDGGLCRNGKPKATYKVLDRLINQEWTTKGDTTLVNSECGFRGFYGTYEITISSSEGEKAVLVDFNKNGKKQVKINI